MAGVLLVGELGPRPPVEVHDNLDVGVPSPADQAVEILQAASRVAATSKISVISPETTGAEVKTYCSPSFTSSSLIQNPTGTRTVLSPRLLILVMSSCVVHESQCEAKAASAASCPSDSTHCHSSFRPPQPIADHASPAIQGSMMNCDPRFTPRILSRPGFHRRFTAGEGEGIRAVEIVSC